MWYTKIKYNTTDKCEKIVHLSKTWKVWCWLVFQKALPVRLPYNTRYKASGNMDGAINRKKIWLDTEEEVHQQKNTKHEDRATTNRLKSKHINVKVKIQISIQMRICWDETKDLQL